MTLPSLGLCAADSSSLHQPELLHILFDQGRVEGIRYFVLAWSTLHLTFFPQQLGGSSASSSGSIQRLLHQPRAGPMPGTWNVSHFSAEQEGGRLSSVWVRRLPPTESFSFACTLLDLWINKDFLFLEIPLF